MSDDMEELLRNLNENCLNKDKRGHVPWQKSHIHVDRYGGREGRCHCITVGNGRGQLRYEMCKNCDRTITEYRRYPLTQGVDLLQLQEDVTDSRKKLEKLQRENEELKMQISGLTYDLITLRKNLEDRGLHV